MSSNLFSSAEPNRTKAIKKPRILVVDDEQDNLDLLYRTFRREFEVFRATSGIQALEILAKEGEMAAIISDQRMPEMKGTEFLRRTVADFPDTMRIVLTGYTDINDLIEAINSGQVHKYITKPWEPNQLKIMMFEATQSYDLLKQRSEELRRSLSQNALLATITKFAQTSEDLASGIAPLAHAFLGNFGADGVLIQLLENDDLTHLQVICGSLDWDLTSKPLADLVQEAILGKSQVSWNLDNSEHPCQTYAAIAIRFREHILGILLMGWASANAISSDDLAAIQQCADEVALALTSIRFYAKGFTVK